MGKSRTKARRIPWRNDNGKTSRLVVDTKYGEMDINDIYEQWGDLITIKPNTLRDRLAKGMDVEQAIFNPPKTHMGNLHYIEKRQTRWMKKNGQK